MVAELPAFTERDRASLEAESEAVDWDALAAEVAELDEIIEQLPLGSGVGVPSIRNGDTFSPGGWAGEFAGGVRVLPAAPDSSKGDDIDAAVYEEFVAGARRVAGTYGIRSASAELALLPQAVRERKSIYLQYSRWLIQLTERLFEGRLPVRVERRTHIAHDLRGSPDFARTLAEQARGTGRVASRETRFSILTPVVRLLSLFHRDLAARLDGLQSDFGLGDARVDRQLGYHRSVREARLPVEAVEGSAMENLPAPDDLEQMASSQFKPVRELQRLWRGYQQDRATELDWETRFDAAVKPVQRVYELWCLERILGILTESLGAPTPADPDRLPVPHRYDFPDGVSLFYDRSVRAVDGTQISRHAGPKFRTPGRQVGNPDFLITENREAVWVADAKFQIADHIDTSGLYRFLGYVVDFLPETDAEAALLCAAGEPIINQTDIESRETRVLATMSDRAGTETQIMESLSSVISGCPPPQQAGAVSEHCE